MGEVLRVRHLQWGVDLAVKSPKAEWFETEAQRELFAAEVETWASLGLHPNICGFERQEHERVRQVGPVLARGGGWLPDQRLDQTVVQRDRVHPVPPRSARSQSIHVLAQDGLPTSRVLGVRGTVI